MGDSDAKNFLYERSLSYVDILLGGLRCWDNRKYACLPPTAQLWTGQPILSLYPRVASVVPCNPEFPVMPSHQYALYPRHQQSS